MPELEKIEESMRVPGNTGIEGFLQVIRKILKLGRVQTVHIEASGKVTWSRYVPTGTPATPQEDLMKDDPSLFESVTPSALIRNADIVELQGGIDPLKAVAALFNKVLFEGLFPIAWVSGHGSRFWEWHAQATGLPTHYARDEAYGLPFFRDPKIPDEALILCASTSRGGAMVDLKKSYKLTMLVTTGMIGSEPLQLDAPTVAEVDIPAEEPPAEEKPS